MKTCRQNSERIIYKNINACMLLVTKEEGVDIGNNTSANREEYSWKFTGYV